MSAFPSRDVVDANYRVSIEVDRFEQMPDRSIALEARWELVRGNGASPLAVHSASFSEQSAGSDPSAVVEAMSRAAAQLSQEIARTIETNADPIAVN